MESNTTTPRRSISSAGQSRPRHGVDDDGDDDDDEEKQISLDALQHFLTHRHPYREERLIHSLFNSTQLFGRLSSFVGFSVSSLRAIAFNRCCLLFFYSAAELLLQLLELLLLSAVVSFAISALENTVIQPCDAPNRPECVFAGF